MILRLKAHTRPVLILSILALGSAAPVLVGSRVGAQESKDLVSIQVRLLESGAPLDADLDLVFEVYDQESGGTLLWSETQSGVPVRNGILAARLGVSTPLGNVFKSGLGGSTDRWVAIKEDGSEIVPRVFLTAVPYAQGASAADIASAIWNQATGTALAITDIPGAIFGAGLEADSSGRLRLAPATGAGLTGGGGSDLAVDPGAFVNTGSAAIDGDRLEISYGATNYTPRIPGTGEAQSLDELAAHLVGIDDALAASGGGGGAVSVIPMVAGGRLSLAGGDLEPVTVADVTTNTLHYLQVVWDRVAVYNGSAWGYAAIPAGSGATLAVSGFPEGGDPDTNYDVFGYDDAGVLALEAVAWGSATSRASSIARHDGVWVKDGTPTRRYLGTVRLNGSTLLEDSSARRFVWNVSNQIPRTSFRRDGTTSWTYASVTPAAFNASDPDWKIEFVQGLGDRPVSGHLSCQLTGTAGASYTWIGFGLDSSSFDSSNASFASELASGLGNEDPVVVYNKLVTAGYHYLQAVHSTAGGTTTFWGGSGASGMRLTIWQ